MSRRKKQSKRRVMSQALRRAARKFFKTNPARKLQGIVVGNSIFFATAR